MEDPQVVSSIPPPVDTAAAGALAYVTILPEILFLILEPYNKRRFIKFHAFQSIGLGLGWFLVIPILGWIVGFLGDVALFVCRIMCIMKA